MKYTGLLMNSLAIFIELFILNFIIKFIALNMFGSTEGGFSLFLLIVISIIASFILSYSKRIQLKPFFIIRKLLKKDFYGPIAYLPGDSQGPVRAPSARPNRNVIKTASNRGVITGYEPRSLSNVVYTPDHKAFGSPGKGLNNASGMNAGNVKLGQTGEANFAKALVKAGMDKRFAVLWSVRMPDNDGLFPSRKFNTDIDCIIVTNNTVYLIDLKNYAGGDVTYEVHGEELYTIDNTTGSLVGKPKKLSRNMNMAQELFRKHMPGVNFSTAVVFMPTDKGAGVMNNVYWPGGIPGVNLTDFLNHLNNESYSDNARTLQVVNSIKPLVA